MTANGEGVNGQERNLRLRVKEPRPFPIHLIAERDCPKRGRNGVSALDLASVRTPKQPDKYHFGVPYGYVVGASETFGQFQKDNSRKPLFNLSDAYALGPGPSGFLDGCFRRRCGGGYLARAEAGKPDQECH
jgi:hypothetical protein